ncbi:MAG: hypothetical protein COU29_01855 [Candidatus Magasanikbacteria bacterium CG10_big_fil_rev_8_21_14_0_10_36_32]|uniref:Uncharacterized protein n=1 Tax=Candidatus Magasanikbacteria bacterium CG10_big_fil_rev_8_21_14_0_10_36_32 TaxID=1974646 RepID=A0A2M6W6X4_9BACT|nr:MAG: hypothetical protein COU29_01855 [Candidatus Magasanikbacteria bacterium CG10_big_fil_rev_8_21_14_0_10_36_32]
MDIIFKIIGALGLISIIAGVVNLNSIRRNWFFVVGGILLLTYSIYLRDPIFIPLQAIFTTVSLYEIYKITYKKI